MPLRDAQHDLRSAYYGGAPGLFSSGVVWLVAGVVALQGELRPAIFALLIGGVFIHPLGVLIAKLAGRRGTHAPSNTLGRLALEVTGILLLGIALAYVLSLARPDLFFPAMLLVIGGRYLTFQTLYGLKVYWVCGAVLAALGIAGALLRLPPASVALAGGATELVFAAIVFVQEKRAHRESTAAVE